MVCLVAVEKENQCSRPPKKGRSESVDTKNFSSVCLDLVYLYEVLNTVPFHELKSSLLPPPSLITPKSLMSLSEDSLQAWYGISKQRWLEVTQLLEEYVEKA